MAQQITVVTESQPFALWISLAAVAVALGAAILTYIQGRAIRQIESREHEWQSDDRQSASIQVVPQSERYSTEIFGDTRSELSTWIRLRNIGRAPARNVEWSISDEGPRLRTERASLDVIYPGEHYDLPYTRTLGSKRDPIFTVSWTDELGRHTTERVLSA